VGRTDTTETTEGRDQMTETVEDSGEPIKVRRYKKRDRRAVLRIAERSFEGVCLDENIEQQFGEVGDNWRVHKKSAVDYDLQNHPRSVFVAVVDGHVVGFVCNRLYRSRRLGHVANLAVSKQHQSRGIGRALMHTTMEYFRREGMDFARIETLEQNERGRQFYPILGFKEVARQVFYVKEL
jgi:ribosomal protein S18 acetylase RimI-like enzyme